MDPERTFYITALLLLMIFNLFPPFNASDTITGTNFISDNKKEALISSNGNFKLGFFSPGNSIGRYVGIWFNKVSKQTVVWVANRETPLNNSTGTFKITKDGNLAVFDGNKSTPIWSTNISMPSTNPTAKLLPSGNLVLVVANKSGNKEAVLWQSFDHPTDTVLPGMKFGLNQKTGLNLVLTSWKSSDDPASGEFSARLDPQGLPQFLLYKKSVPNWRGGPWNGRTLNGIPDIATYELDYSNEIDIFNYTYVANHNEIYITFTARNNTIFSILTLELMGTLQRLLWRDEDHTWARFWIAPQDSCDEYARCGAYAICNSNNAAQCACLPGFEPLYPQDWYAKCVEKRKVVGCGRGEGQGFVKLAPVKVPDARVSRIYGNMSLQECERECLKSCNCTGYASADVSGSGTGCIAWYGELKDIEQYEDGQDFYLRVDAVELAAQERKASKGDRARKRTLVFIIVPIVLVVLMLVACCYYLWRKHAKRRGREKKQRRREMLFLDSATSLSDHKKSPNANRQEESRSVEVTFFELSTVVAATDNFSSANKLGQGGFGPVYKGQLSDGREIAVKRLSKKSEQGIVEFRNEVLLIAKLQHRNLVRLLGCCIEEEEKMLVYEFMPNKSLDYFIFDQSRKLLLDWKKRYEIILGIARGILYLHQDSRLRIIHRDLKASNILLDGEMNPKISDFGTARIFGGDQSEANTNRVVGTYGYMSPEYALDGLFSMKSDVFSFGVLLLEIISGKKNAGFFHDDPSLNLIRNAWEMWRDDKALEIVDSFMCNSCPASEVLRCIQVGFLCVQDSTEERPTMSNVVFMLSNETTLPSPTQPTFAIRRVQNNPESSTTGTKSSMNELTITMLDAR